VFANVSHSQPNAIQASLIAYSMSKVKKLVLSWPANIRLGCKQQTIVTNTIAYYRIDCGCKTLNNFVQLFF
jgi:hypothetical protein